jgi:FkbM family methyltransferase
LLEPDASYRLNDLLRYNDVEFINAAYQAMLNREADKDGMQTYLAMLRDGASKPEILGRLRDSPEGRLRRARVDGLSLPYVLDAISRWPIIGKFVGVLTAFWNLPDAQRTERRTLNDFASRLDGTDRGGAEATRTTCDALETLEQSQNGRAISPSSSDGNSGESVGVNEEDKIEKMDDRTFELLTTISDRLKRLEAKVTEIRSLVGPFGTAFPDGSMLVQTIYGLKYFIDPCDEIMAPQLVVYRQWEPDLSRFFLNSVTTDTVFVDVGANFGYFTCLLASRIGRNGKGKVISIEPNPAMQELLKKNARINWSMSPIEICDCAVSERAGVVNFRVPTGRAANASMGTSTPARPGETQFMVPAKSLDDLLGGAVVNLIKIDVEGFETAVLRGATNTLRNSPNVQIVLEWSLAQTRTAGFSPDDLLREFEKQRLSAYHLPQGTVKTDAEWLKLEINADILRATNYENILLRRSPSANTLNQTLADPIEMNG